MISDVDNWDRGNFGRRFSFISTDEEVQDWLLRRLPPKYAPYRLVSYDRVPGDGQFYVDEPLECDLAALLSCRQETDPPRWHFFIWSKALTPDLQRVDHQPRLGIDKLWIYNGLVLLQFLTARGKRLSTDLVIVDKVRNLKTGEVQEHREYLEIFQALRKEISKALCYATIYRSADGSEWEDARGERWTEAAARAYREGLPFFYAPGGRIEKQRRSSPRSSDG